MATKDVASNVAAAVLFEGPAPSAPATSSGNPEYAWFEGGQRTDKLATAADWTRENDKVKRLVAVPREFTVHNSEIDIVTNGKSIQGDAYLTFKEWDSIMTAINLRKRADMISKFGTDGTGRKRSVNVLVGTLSGS